MKREDRKNHAYQRFSNVSKFQDATIDKRRCGLKSERERGKPNKDKTLLDLNPPPSLTISAIVALRWRHGPSFGARR